MNKSSIFVFLLFLLSNPSVWAQPMSAKPTPASATKPSDATEIAPPATKSEYEKNYQERVNQSKLMGQYIPKDIFDAFKELNRLTDSVSRDKFKAATEFDVEHKLYFSLGRWVASNWGLYEGSRYGQYFREAGLSYPEDQAITTLICWHRFLNKKDIGFKEVRDRLVAKRKKEREERLKKMEVIEEKVIKKQ
jgi:hypothetical protein